MTIDIGTILVGGFGSMLMIVFAVVGYFIRDALIELKELRKAIGDLRSDFSAVHSVSARLMILEENMRLIRQRIHLLVESNASIREHIGMAPLSVITESGGRNGR